MQHSCKRSVRLRLDAKGPVENIKLLHANTDWYR